jgi:TetR/AcrR family transcriptional regulator, transcriptional repressor for nem operon
MGSSQADKAASHERIVTAAAARVRRDGVAGISVAELMSEAGLTHGGFYRHFASRDELIAEAVEAALAHGSRRTDAAAELGGIPALTAIIDGYLSQLHRDKPESGCAVAALPSDVARGDQRTRDAYTAQVQRYLDLLDALLPEDDRGVRRDDALLTLAALVGAVSLARAVADGELSDEILAGTAHALRRQLVDPAPQV